MADCDGDGMAMGGSAAGGYERPRKRIDDKQKDCARPMSRSLPLALSDNLETRPRPRKAISIATKYSGDYVAFSSVLVNLAMNNPVSIVD